MIKKLFISSATAATLVFSTLSSAMDVLELGRDEATANQQKLHETANSEQLGAFASLPFETFKQIMDYAYPDNLLFEGLGNNSRSEQDTLIRTQCKSLTRVRTVNSFFMKHFQFLPLKIDLDKLPNFFRAYKENTFEFWGSYVTSSILYTDKALSIASKIGASFPHTKSITLGAQLLTKKLSLQLKTFFPHLESLHGTGYFLDHEYDNGYHYTMKKILPLLEGEDLKFLTLDHNRIGENGVRYLSTLPSLSKLEYLSLKNCMLQKSKYTSGERVLSSVKELIESPHMQQLKILDLRNFKDACFTRQDVGKKTANVLDLNKMEELAALAEERGLTILY